MARNVVVFGLGVLIMRQPQARRRFLQVLCPIDLSAHSRIALRHAAAVAEEDGGTLTVLFVNDPLLNAAAAAAYDGRRMAELIDKEVAQFVRKALPPATFARVAPVIESRMGQPAREIVRRARDGGFDLLVMGTRGANAASRLLFGSTTSAVLRRAPIPMLAIPAAGRAVTRKAVPSAAPRRMLGAAGRGRAQPEA